MSSSLRCDAQLMAITSLDRGRGAEGGFVINICLLPCLEVT